LAPDGMNSSLDDNVPVELLRDADATEDFTAVQRVAREFARLPAEP
jgi:hypothetical protein